MNSMERDSTDDEIVGSDFINFIDSNDRGSVSEIHLVEHGEYQHSFHRTYSLVSNNTENERQTPHSYEENTSSSTYDTQRELRTSERQTRSQFSDRQSLFHEIPCEGQPSPLITPSPLSFEQQNASPICDHQNGKTPVQLVNRQASPPVFAQPIASQRNDRNTKASQDKHNLYKGGYDDEGCQTLRIETDVAENGRRTKQSYNEHMVPSTYAGHRKSQLSQRQGHSLPGNRQAIFNGQPHLGQPSGPFKTPSPTFEQQNEQTPLQLVNRQASPPAYSQYIASKGNGQHTKGPRDKQTAYNGRNANKVYETLPKLNSRDKRTSLRDAKKEAKPYRLSANAKYVASCLPDTSVKQSVVAHRSRSPSLHQKSLARRPSSISRSDNRQSTSRASQPASRSTSTSYQFVSPAPHDEFSRSSSRIHPRSVSPTHYCPECKQFYNEIVTCQHSVLGRVEMERSLNFTTTRMSESQDRMGVTIHTVGNYATINYGTTNDLAGSISHQTLRTGSRVRRPEQQTDEQLSRSRGEYSSNSASLQYVPQRQPETREQPLSRSFRAVQYHYNANIKMDHDRNTCDVTDICQLPDGTFAITDTNNMTVKILTDEYEPLSHYRMQALPQYICHVKDQDLAVTLNNWSIHFLNTGESGAIRGPIFPGHVCMGISHYGRKLYVTDGGETLYVYNLNGVCMRTLNNDFFMKQIFSRIRKISVTIEDGTIFVTDLNNGLVMIPKMQENNPEIVPSENVQSAVGLSLDTAYRIYVSGEDSHNVIVIERFSNRVLCNINLLHYEIDAHKAICVDNINHRLLISSHMCNNLIAIDLD